MLRIMENRRSIRKYKKQAVEREKIDKIFTAALLAPTSRGRRPWEFILVDEPCELFDLSKAKAHGSSFVKDSPVAIIVIADTDKSDACIEDTSIAITFMQLEAERLGLGSCWVQIRMRETSDAKSSEAYIRHIFNIPDQYLVEAVVTFGYKGEEKEAHHVDETDVNKVHYNCFGMGYPGKFG